MDDEQIDDIESYICYELYDWYEKKNYIFYIWSVQIKSKEIKVRKQINVDCVNIYSLFTTPGGDESLQDEALESRIAALNLLDLNMEHLGVIVEDESEIEDIEAVVKEAGLQLQQLNSILDAKGKLNGLVRTHQIIAGMY